VPGFLLTPIGEHGTHEMREIRQGSARLRQRAGILASACEGDRDDHAAGRPRAAPVRAHVANLVYALHTFAIAVGIFGTATIVGSFLMSLPSILAVGAQLREAQRRARDWAESHYRWQIRTFWYSIFWCCSRRS